jgi:hypothetical protein
MPMTATADVSVPTSLQPRSDAGGPAVPTNQLARSDAGRATPAGAGERSLRQAALAAGLGLLLMTVLAPIANFGVLHAVIVPGDAATTAHNLEAAPGLFRIAIGLFLAVAMLDVVVAWGLYVVFQPVNRGLSLLAALFRAVYAAMFAVALNTLVSAGRLLGDAAFLNAVGAAHVQAQVLVLLDAFQSGWDLALIVFGVHLFLVGVLVFQSSVRLRLLAVLVIAAGLGYLIDGVGTLLLPDYRLTVAQFTFIGEPVLMLWLLWFGIGRRNVAG